MSIEECLQYSTLFVNIIFLFYWQIYHLPGIGSDNKDMNILFYHYT